MNYLIHVHPITGAPFDNSADYFSALPRAEDIRQSVDAGKVRTFIPQTDGVGLYFDDYTRLAEHPHALAPSTPRGWVESARATMRAKRIADARQALRGANGSYAEDLRTIITRLEAGGW